MFSLSEANEYFEMHLKYALWNELADKTRIAAINMAEQDVKNFLQLDQIDQTCVFSYCAVFEQAVYLVEFFDMLNTPLTVQSESIDGVGSRAFRNERRPGIAPRAMQFIERILPPASISRG